MHNDNNARGNVGIIGFNKGVIEYRRFFGEPLVWESIGSAAHRSAANVPKLNRELATIQAVERRQTRVSILASVREKGVTPYYLLRCPLCGTEQGLAECRRILVMTYDVL